MIVLVMGYRPIIVETIANYVGADVAEITTIDTVADVAGSLNGTYFSMFSGGNNQKHVFWMDLSRAEVTDFTMRADVSGDLFGKHFTFSAPSINYYAWFTRVAVAEVTTVTAAAASTLAATGPGEYYIINPTGAPTSYYIWYDVDGGNVDPAPVGLTGVTVAVGGADTASTVGGLSRTAIDAIAEVSTSGSTTQIVITNDNAGSSTDSADFNTGFSVVTSTQGANPSTDPSIPNRTGIAITIVEGDSANNVATAGKSAIDAIVGLGTGGSTSHVIVTNDNNGSATDALDGDVGGGFSLSITTQGRDILKPKGSQFSNCILAATTFADNAADTVIATALELVTEAQAAFTSLAATNVVTVTAASSGSADDPLDGTGSQATGFALAVTAQGTLALPDNLKYVKITGHIVDTTSKQDHGGFGKVPGAQKSVEIIVAQDQIQRVWED